MGFRRDVRKIGAAICSLIVVSGVVLLLIRACLKAARALRKRRRQTQTGELRSDPVLNSVQTIHTNSPSPSAGVAPFAVVAMPVATYNATADPAQDVRPPPPPYSPHAYQQQESFNPYYKGMQP